MKAWRCCPLLWLLFAARLLAQDWICLNDLTDAHVWNTPDFLAAWPHDSKEAGSAGLVRAALRNPPTLFSLPVRSATARFVHGQIDSLSLVLLDGGEFFGYQNSNLRGETVPQARKEFDEEFTQEKEKLEKALQTVARRAPTTFQPGEHGAFRVKAQMFHLGGVWSRVLAVDHQLLMVDFFRTEQAARSLKTVPPPAAPQVNPFAPRVTSGDQMIPEIPMIAQGNRGYCGAATLAMIGEFLGLQPGAEEYAAFSGFQYGEIKSPDIRELCSRVAQEAGLHAERSERFDFDRARATIDAGLPVLAFRRWSPERDYLQTLYTGRVSRGENASLPEPDMEDRRAWPGKDAPAHASIIHGYNAQRREVIFTESWGEQTRARRMRAEEMEGTSYYAVYFTR